MLQRWLLSALLLLPLAFSFTASSTATVNEVSAANRYSGNGSTTVFSYGFKILAQADIEVVVDSTVKGLTSDYTVSGVGVSGGGSVTFLTAPANGTVVTLLRKQPASQLSDYVPNEAFSAEQLEKDYDKLVMQSQQTRETLAHTLRGEKRETLDLQLPSVAARKNKILAFDTNGLPISVDPTTAVGGDLTLSTVLSTGSTTARSLATRFGEVYNVKDYGAVGNGVADDTVAIQAAVTAAQLVGGTVFLPTGTYLISARLLITKNVALVGSGWGSIIKVDASVARFLPILVEGVAYAAINGVVLRDFKLDGSLKGQLDAGLIQLNNAVDVLVDRVWVTGGGTPGESSSSGVSGIVTSAGAIGEIGTSGTIQHSLIEATTKSGINISTQSRNVTVRDNIIRNCTGNTNTPGIQVLGGINVEIVNNKVHNNQGIGIYSATTGTNPWYNAMYILIEGNHVYSNGQGTVEGYGIAVRNSAGASQQFGRYLVRGNIVYSNGVNVSSSGIFVENDNHVVVEGNHSYLNSSAGIQVNAAQDVLVHGNLLEDNNTTNTGSVSGVYIKSAASVTLGSVTVSNNKMTNNAGQHQKYPVYYDNAAAQTVTDIRIVDNEAKGHETSDGLFFDYMPTRLYVRHRFHGQLTTNATATNVFYVLLNDNSAAQITLRTVGMKDDASDRAMYNKSALIYRDGAGAVLQGAVQTTYEVESNAAWDQTLNVTGNFARGQITGVAATNITWNSELEIRTE